MATVDTHSHVDALLEEIDASLASLHTELPPVPASDTAPHRPKLRPSAIGRLSILLTVHNVRWKIEDFIQRLLETPLPWAVEVIVADEGSTDGTVEFLQNWSTREPRLHVVSQDQRHESALQAAIQIITGDVAVIQTVDLDFQPTSYRNLLQPILSGEADAVYGTRFAGPSRRVMSFWRTLAARCVTGIFNLVNNLNLTDVEAPCKAVRTEFLEQLKLHGVKQSVHAELATRLTQSGARIHEVPITTSLTAASSGIRGKLQSVWQILRCRFLEPCFTSHSGQFILASVARANRYNEWLLERCAPFLGKRLLEAGAGIGNLSTKLTERERLVLVDYDTSYVSRLKSRFQGRSNIRVLQADLTDPQVSETWRAEKLDTIFCSNVLEHLEPDVDVLRSFHQSLTDNGHCIIIVPAEQSLYMPLDQELGHFRRYSQEELRDKMQAAGFEVVFSSQFCKIGALAWWWNGRVLNRRHLSPRQMIWFDRLWPIARHFDRLLPVPGMSLTMVGRRRSKN